MKPVKVLQCGYPKSGNFLFSTIIHSVLTENGLAASFKQKSGLTQLIDSLATEFKLHPDISHLDTFSIVNEQFVLYFPHPDCRSLTPDPVVVVRESNHLWTHDPANTLDHSWLSPVTHAFYLLRDGRDAVNSLVHHMARPEVHKMIRDYQLDTVEKVYGDRAVMTRYIERWAEHARSYLAMPDRFHLLRFEDFVANPQMVIDGMLDYLGLNADVDSIVEQTSFDALAKDAPQHLRKGSVGDWRSYFTSEHVDLFKELAGDVLIQLGYEQDDHWNL